MTTLLDHSTQRRSAKAAEATAFEQQLALATKDLADANQAIEGVLEALATNDRATSIARRALDAAETPPLRGALVAELEAHDRARNQLQRRLQANRLVADVAERRQTLSSARATQARSRLKQVEAEHADIVGGHDRRTRLAGDFAALGPLRAEAAALLAPSAELAAARAVFANVPTKLASAAGSRARALLGVLELERGVVDDAVALLDAKHAADGGLEGAIPGARRSFERAEARLADYVDGAKLRLAAAKATIARLGAAGVRLIAPAEAQKLAALDVAAAADATDHEAAVSAALAVVDGKTRVLARARLAARLADPAASDVAIEAVAAVATARGEVTTAEGTLAAARAAFTDDDRARLSEWQGAMSTEAWQGLLDLTVAEGELNALAAPPAALDTSLVTAEDGYVAAIVAAEDGARALELASAAVDDAVVLLVAGGRRLGAMLAEFRGDAND